LGQIVPVEQPNQRGHRKVEHKIDVRIDRGLDVLPAEPRCSCAKKEDKEIAEKAKMMSFQFTFFSLYTLDFFLDLMVILLK
jgi:hypothetical protein